MKNNQNLSKDLNFNQAANLAQVLDNYQIPYQIDPPLHPVEVGGIAAVNFDKQYNISVSQEYYLPAIEAVGSMETLASIADEHPFDNFSDEELTAVHLFSEEWSRPDYDYANKLIQERNIAIEDSVKDQIIEDQILQFKEPMEANLSTIIVGYLMSFLGGFLGLIVALELVNKEKTIEGETLKYYDAKSRDHGQNMLLISMLWILIYLIAWSA